MIPPPTTNYRAGINDGLTIFDLETNGKAAPGEIVFSLGLHLRVRDAREGGEKAEGAETRKKL